MSSPYIGEIRIFGFNFAPRDWAYCNGQLLSIAQNTALFSILGTTYGGNGTTVFGLPDFQGRVPTHAGTNNSSGQWVLGQQAGEENHTLLTSEMPLHTHTVSASSNAAGLASPSTAFFGNGPQPVYSPAGSIDSTLAVAAVGTAGGNQAHPNVAPSMVLNFCIALQGIFPSRN